MHRLGLLDLRDHAGLRSRVVDELPEFANIVGRAHERQGDEVGADVEREREVPAILLGQRRDGKRDAGKVHALMALDGPADDNGAHGASVVDALDAKAHVAVVDQHVMANLEHSAHDLGRDRQVDLSPLGAHDHLVAPGEHHPRRQVADP